MRKPGSPAFVELSGALSSTQRVRGCGNLEREGGLPKSAAVLGQQGIPKSVGPPPLARARKIRELGPGQGLCAEQEPLRTKPFAAPLLRRRLVHLFRRL